MRMKISISVFSNGISHVRTHDVGIHYFNFKTKKDAKRAYSIANKVIDKSKEDVR